MELLKASSPDPLHQEVNYKKPSSYSKMESLVKEMQDPETGVPVRSQKLFLTSIPAAFAGYDIIEWLMERLAIEDSMEAIHLANLLCQHGYFFPVGDNRTLTVKDDSSLYRFQTPYYWPSQVPCLDNVDYAIYLSKRTMRNKQKHGLEDYELEALSSLRKNLAQKWDFITMQADEQVRISKDRKKVDKMVTDSQERAFWRVIRPPPGTISSVETPPMFTNDFHSHEGKKQKGRTNLLEDLKAEVDLLRISCLRSRTKVSQALESLASHCEVYHEHDAFLVTRQPSNPWITDDTYYWIINAPLVEVPVERRVKKWSISMENLVFDHTGLREFTAYLKKEYCHENIRFWLAVRDLRYGPMSEIKKKAQEIYNEFLSPGAPCEINIDMRTMEAVQKEMNYLTPSRFVFDPAADHVYAMLLKKDCYPRYIRSDQYKTFLANALQINQKKRFFSFAAPTKKKSSATNPLIFPVSAQSATAGIGEVVKVADEVILLTTGNKPGDFLAASNTSNISNQQNSEKLSKLPDIPYRSQSFDDVCPWESMEKLPDKSVLAAMLETNVKPSCSKSLLESGKSGSIPALLPTAASSTQNIPSASGAVAPPLSSSYSSSTSVPAPSTSGSYSIYQSNNEPQPSTSAAAMAASSAVPSTSSTTSATKLPKQESVTSTGSFSGSKKSESITSGKKVQYQPSTSGTSKAIRQQSTVSSHSTKSEKEILSPKSSTTSSKIVEPIVPTVESSTCASNKNNVVTSSNNNSTTTTTTAKSSTPASNNVSQQQQQQPQPNVTSTEPDKKNESKDDLVCPWDYENGSQPESTTFVKTYSTLGYL